VAGQPRVAKRQFHLSVPCAKATKQTRAPHPWALPSGPHAIIEASHVLAASVAAPTPITRAGQGRIAVDARGYIKVDDDLRHHGRLP